MFKVNMFLSKYMGDRAKYQRALDKEMEQHCNLQEQAGKLQPVPFLYLRNFGYSDGKFEASKDDYLILMDYTDKKWINKFKEINKSTGGVLPKDMSLTQGNCWLTRSGTEGNYKYHIKIYEESEKAVERKFGITSQEKVQLNDLHKDLNKTMFVGMNWTINSVVDVPVSKEKTKQETTKVEVSGDLSGNRGLTRIQELYKELRSKGDPKFETNFRAGLRECFRNEDKRPAYYKSLLEYQASLSGSDGLRKDIQEKDDVFQKIDKEDEVKQIDTLLALREDLAKDGLDPDEIKWFTEHVEAVKEKIKKEAEEEFAFFKQKEKEGIFFTEPGFEEEELEDLVELIDTWSKVNKLLLDAKQEVIDVTTIKTDLDKAIQRSQLRSDIRIDIEKVTLELDKVNDTPDNLFRIDDRIDSIGNNIKSLESTKKDVNEMIDKFKLLASIKYAA